jgi:hypothetical protein
MVVRINLHIITSGFPGLMREHTVPAGIVAIRGSEAAGEAIPLERHIR